MGFTDHLFIRKKNYLTNGMTQDEIADINQKINATLIRHVYMQKNTALYSSILCAFLVFCSIYLTLGNNFKLLGWTFFWAIGIGLNYLSVIYFKRRNYKRDNMQFWRNVYIMTSMISGLSWGLTAIFFPEATIEQKMLLVLMLAGVTAGVVPLSSAVPEAAVAFLVCATLPYLMVFAIHYSLLSWFFNIALCIYLIYSILLTLKSYHIIYDVNSLNFQKHYLLKELSDAKSKLEITNTQLEFAATHDSLTHVANRNLFTRNLNIAMRKAKSSNAILALLYIDLDFFKKVNDVYGHHIGDQVLILIIERLKTLLLSADSISRLGGDELTVLLDKIKSMKEAERVAEKICKLIAMPIEIEGVIFKLSASIGISFYPMDGLDLETLLWRADQAMYYVKQHGGNNYYSKAMVEMD